MQLEVEFRCNKGGNILPVKNKYDFQNQQCTTVVEKEGRSLNEIFPSSSLVIFHLPFLLCLFIKSGKTFYQPRLVKSWIDSSVGGLENHL